MATKKICDNCGLEIVDNHTKLYLTKDGMAFYAKVSDFRKTDGLKADLCSDCQNLLLGGSLVIKEPLV